MNYFDMIIITFHIIPLCFYLAHSFPWLWLWIMSKHGTLTMWLQFLGVPSLKSPSQTAEKRSAIHVSEAYWKVGKGMIKTYQRGSFWNDIPAVIKGQRQWRKNTRPWKMVIPCVVNPGVIRTTPKMQADDKLPWSKHSTEMHSEIRCQ